jgi:hypothetical protein
MTNPVTLRQCKAELDKHASEYPQYHGYCDGWVPATAIKPYSNKGGIAMIRGDVVLVDPNSEEIGGRDGKPRPFMRIWSGRRKGFIMVDKRAIHLADYSLVRQWTHPPMTLSRVGERRKED